MYTLITDYKHNTAYRRSFNALANMTFGIDFEAWYQNGFWNEQYVCYSYVYEEEVVANVSLNQMLLLIEGKFCRAIQIGTVMTHPEHRRKGLAYDLLCRVLADYDSDLYLLAANEEAVPLYEKCGFVRSPENRYEICTDGYRLLEEPLRPVSITAEALLKQKRKAKPLSQVLSAPHDEHIFMFYYVSGFHAHIYEPRPGVYSIFEIEGDTLHLYDIIAENEVDLAELVEWITPHTVKRIVCHFAPNQAVPGLHAERDATSNWMVRAVTATLPTEARFPKISQA